MVETSEHRLNKSIVYRTIIICVGTFICCLAYMSWRSDDIHGYAPISALIIMLADTGFWIFSIGSALARRNLKVFFYVLGCGLTTILLSLIFIKNSDHIRFWVMSPIYAYQIIHTPSDANGHKRVEWPWAKNFNFDSLLVYDSENPKHFDRQKKSEYSTQDGCRIEFDYMFNNFYIDTTTCGVP